MPSRSVVRVKVGVGRASSTDPSRAVVKSPPTGSSPSPSLSNDIGQDDDNSSLTKVTSNLVVEKSGVDSHAKDSSSKFGVNYNNDTKHQNVEARDAKVWSMATTTGQDSEYAFTPSNAPSKLCGISATETKLAAASMTKDVAMGVAAFKVAAEVPAKHHIMGDAGAMRGESAPLTKEETNKEANSCLLAKQHMVKRQKDDAKRGEDGQRINSDQDANMQPITSDDSSAAKSFEPNDEEEIIPPTLPSMDDTKECLPHLQNGERNETHSNSKQNQYIGNETHSTQNQNIAATQNTAPNNQGPVPQYPSWQYYPPQGSFPMPPQQLMMYPPYPPPYGFMMPPPLPPAHPQPAQVQLSENQTPPPPKIEENVSLPQAHPQSMKNKRDTALALLKKNASLALAQQEPMQDKLLSNRTPPIIEENTSPQKAQPQTERVESCTALALPRSEKKNFAKLKDERHDKARPKSETKCLPREEFVVAKKDIFVQHASAKENDQPLENPYEIPWHMLSSTTLSQLSSGALIPQPSPPKPQVKEAKVPWQKLMAKDLEESPGKKRKLGSSKIMEML